MAGPLSAIRKGWSEGAIYLIIMESGMEQPREIYRTGDNPHPKAPAKGFLPAGMREQLEDPPRTNEKNKRSEFRKAVKRYGAKAVLCLDDFWFISRTVGRDKAERQWLKEVFLSKPPNNDETYLEFLLAEIVAEMGWERDEHGQFYVQRLARAIQNGLAIPGDYAIGGSSPIVSVNLPAAMMGTRPPTQIQELKKMRRQAARKRRLKESK